MLDGKVEFLQGQEPASVLGCGTFVEDCQVAVIGVHKEMEGEQVGLEVHDCAVDAHQLFFECVVA